MRTRFEREALNMLESVEDSLAERIEALVREFLDEFLTELDDNVNEDTREEIDLAFERVMHYWRLHQR